MSNDFYTVSGAPGTGSFGSSAAIRGEFQAIQDGFNKMPALTPGTVVVVKGDGTGLTNTVGGLVLAGNLSTTGAFNTTLVQQATTTLTLPAASTTLIGRDTTDTLTNKTFDTAGDGNVFKINETEITDVTGTGKAVLDTSPTISSPTLKAPITLTSTAGASLLARDYTGAGSTNWALYYGSLTPGDGNYAMRVSATDTMINADMGGHVRTRINNVDVSVTNAAGVMVNTSYQDWGALSVGNTYSGTPTSAWNCAALNIQNTTPFSSGVSGYGVGLIFEGQYNTNGDYAAMGGIYNTKGDGVSGDYSGNQHYWVRGDGTHAGGHYFYGGTQGGSFSGQTLYGFFGNDGSFNVNGLGNGGWSGFAKMEARQTGNGYALSGYGTASTSKAMLLRVDSTSANLIDFFYGSSSVGSISTNGTIISVNGTSDPRAKNVFGPFQGAGAIVDAISVYDAEYKAAPGKRRAMFLAPEVQRQIAYAVMGEENAEDDDGNAIMQQLGSIDPLMPVLWAALRETRSALQDTQNELAALKAQLAGE